MVTTAYAVYGKTDPRFLDQLDVRYIDGTNWRVMSEFDYHTDVALPEGKNVIRITAPFETDFASIPRAFQNIYSPTGSYGRIAVIHDALYRTPGLATKAQADDVFLEGMEALGTGWFSRHVIYTGVHLFGGGAYKGGL